MGLFFRIFSYFTQGLAILLLALAIASGLYLLTELTEEFPTLTGKFLKYILIVTSVIQICLWLDGLPTLESLIQIASFFCNYLMLKDFPFVEIISFPTISSVLLFLITNGFWLRYFILVEHYAPLPTIGFFITNVWLLPCGLFISLSINDNTLPGMIGKVNRDNGITMGGGVGGGRHRSIFRMIFDGFYSQIAAFGGILNPIKLLQDKKK